MDSGESVRSLLFFVLLCRRKVVLLLWKRKHRSVRKQNMVQLP